MISDHKISTSTVFIAPFLYNRLFNKVFGVHVHKNNVFFFFFCCLFFCLFVLGFLHVTDGKEWCELSLGTYLNGIVEMRKQKRWLGLDAIYHWGPTFALELASPVATYME